MIMKLSSIMSLSTTPPPQGAKGELSINVSSPKRKSHPTEEENDSKKMKLPPTISDRASPRLIRSLPIRTRTRPITPDNSPKLSATLLTPPYSPGADSIEGAMSGKDLKRNEHTNEVEKNCKKTNNTARATSIKDLKRTAYPTEDENDCKKMNNTEGALGVNESNCKETNNTARGTSINDSKRTPYPTEEKNESKSINNTEGAISNINGSKRKTPPTEDENDCKKIKLPPPDRVSPRLMHSLPIRTRSQPVTPVHSPRRNTKLHTRPSSPSSPTTIQWTTLNRRGGPLSPIAQQKPAEPWGVALSPPVIPWTPINPCGGDRAAEEVLVVDEDEEEDLDMSEADDLMEYYEGSEEEFESEDEEDEDYEEDKVLSLLGVTEEMLWN